ncbi:hypothetical protein ORV05_16815 [Amycolatopsis cynarae]|uniref:Potassium-transporting ATPase n=1 Tax=Amycolatopsis cynarae TaxID=2995223 RepID=A0ABY7BAG4_9PSEU|nr:hypothetical protein [Amycolatopsis sp. HUAS 11-8]WAL69360.1 hypothetical protein ORV05_16815 [Amycolatopsis sp. HUAS 11-8]
MAASGAAAGEENGGGASMPDVLYVVLLIGLFGVLALILRGLERL